MRHSYAVPMRWMVIYKYEVPGGTLNLSYTKLPRPWSPWESSSLRKNPHGRTRNWTQDLMISSQKLWPLDHEAGQGVIILNYIYRSVCLFPTAHVKQVCHILNQNFSPCIHLSVFYTCTYTIGIIKLLMHILLLHFCFLISESPRSQNFMTPLVLGPL
jgi:hypothetical protein